jgi:hypothetical protein
MTWPPHVLKLACLATASALLAGELVAQQPGNPQGETRTHLVLDIGVLSLGLSFAGRVHETHLSLGAGVWGAWSPPSTFDRPVFEPIGGAFFARASYPGGQIDAGVGVLRYSYADECSSCSGTFIGLRLGAHLGHGKVLVGPDLWVGGVTDGGHGADVGFLVDFQVRFVIGAKP